MPDFTGSPPNPADRPMPWRNQLQGVFNGSGWPGQGVGGGGVNYTLNNGQGAAAVAGNPGTGGGTPGQFNMGNPEAMHQQWRDMQAMPGTTLISSLPQQRQDRMTQRWGIFGGGQPMPSTLGDFRTAKQTYFTAHPDQRPGYGMAPRYHQRLAQALMQG
jgi:hypothetical protein